MELNQSSFVNDTVISRRKLYTPTDFAKENLLYLQEVGSLQALQAHSNGRQSVQSLLFFIVLDGSGSLTYHHQTYALSKGDAVFINCIDPYIHSTSNDLWSIQWVHFYGNNALNLYHKYKQRGGDDVLHQLTIEPYQNLLSSIYDIATSDTYLKDMHIYQQLVCLVTLLMEKSWNPSKMSNPSQINDCLLIKNYLDTNYLNPISLEQLATQFALNKYTLIRQFKHYFGLTIGQYIQNKRLSLAKEKLRYSDDTIEQIAYQCGYEDSNYFIRLFKKFEGNTPYQYRKSWKSTH